MDSSPLDMFVIDEITGAPYRLDLLNTIDLYTSSIASYRFTTRGPKAVDAVLGLADALTGRLFKPRAPSYQPRYLGVPDQILLDERAIAYEPNRLGGARRRSFPVDMVVADHGLIYPSAAFTEACDRLQIDVQLARIRKPTDKPHVESLFSAINSQFAQLFGGMGYSGGRISERGRDPEADACFYAYEVERYYEAWVEHYWQERVPEGHDLSPNQRYDISIARAGYLTVPVSASLYFELLPKAWLTIGDRGVRIGGLFYDDLSGTDILHEFRHQRSDYDGRYPGRWPIAYDGRDLSKVWFRHPESGHWHALERRGSRMPTAAFTDVQLADAKAIVKARGGTTKDDLELSRTLDEICYLITSARLTGGDRRKAIKARYDASQVIRDIVDPLAEVRKQGIAEVTELDTDSDEFAVESGDAETTTVDYAEDGLVEFLMAAARGREDDDLYNHE